MAQSLLKAMLADAPSALWPLDDAAGGSVGRDVSGNGRHLAYVSSPALSTAQVIPGDPVRVWSPALNTQKCAQIAATPAWAGPGAGDFLFTTWFRGATVNPSAQSFECLFAFDQNESGNGVDIYVVNTWVSAAEGSVRVWYAGTVLQTATANLHDGKAHLVWVEKRSGTLTIYVDNVSLGSGARGTPTIGTSPLWVGGTATGGNTYGQNNPSGYAALWTNGAALPAASRQAVYLAEAQRAGVTY